MKKFFIIFSLLFLSIFNNVKANNIAFINMDKLLSTSKAGLNLLSQLNELNNNNADKFKKNEKSLKSKETQIISQKNILSEDKFNKEIAELKLSIKKYNEDRNKILNNFNKIKLDSTNKFLQLINPILKSYADQKSIDIILQKKNIILGKTAFDITDEIIIIVNKDIKEFKIK